MSHREAPGPVFSCVRGHAPGPCPQAYTEAYTNACLEEIYG